jgi:hypothetical protein
LSAEKRKGRRERGEEKGEKRKGRREKRTEGDVNCESQVAGKGV